MAKRKPSAANDIAAKAEPFIQRIENLLTEKKAFCDGCADDIKEVYGEAEEDGISPKVLRKIVRRRKLERDIEGLGQKLDIDEAAQFSALAQAFAGTPFGEHAKARAEEARRQGERDVGDGGMHLVEEGYDGPREDEQHLTQIGRGDVIDELTER